MIGKNILHYKIIEKLGEGGMGIVYKAMDTKLNREVAIKVLPPHLLVSEDDRARFHREAKAAAALNHSNIATVYEINESDEKPFIVMEYIEGATLDHTISKGPMKLDEAIAITIQIADGLGAAHKRGVVHRDIKASNILYSADKKAKILDFGLAKTSMSTKLTQMGTTIGTVAYMSPEQVQGKEVDHRTDLWSLGILLYEMIAGHLPFKAEYDQAIFYSIQNENPDPLTAIRTGVPMSLEWIVNKLMAKDQDERYQSTKDLIIDLKAIDLDKNGFSRIAKSTIQKPFDSISKKKKFSSNAYKSIAVAAIIFLIYFVIQYFVLINRPATGSLHFNITAVEDNKVQVFRSDVQVIAISPDGNKIAYTVVDHGNTTLYIKSLEDFKITKLEELGNVTGGPFFSPDGNFIGFNADGQLKRVSLLNGTIDVIYDKPAYRGASWIDNNTIIYTASYNTGLTLLNISTGTLTNLTTVDTARGERTHRWPQILPDGKHVLFTIGNVNSPNSYEDAELAIYSFEDKTKHILSIKGEMARYIEPGYMVIGKNGKLLAAPFNLSDYKFLKPPESVLNDVEGDVGSGISYFGLSATGNIIYIKGTRNQSLQLVWVDKKGKVESLPLPENPYMLPRISPDGKKILVNIGMQSTSRDVWIYDLETSLFRRLTFRMTGLYPEWNGTSDGVYYMSLTGGDKVELTFLSLINGATKLIKNYSANTATSIMSVSPDDKYMLLNVIGNSNAWKWELLNLQTKKSFKANNLGRSQFGGNFSPNGKYIAYTSSETDRLEVNVTNFPQIELKWQISNNGGFSPRWSRDGSELYYISNNGKLMRVPIQYKPTFLPGKPAELIDVSQMLFPNDNADNYDVAPDGKRFLMIKNSNAQAQLNSFNMIYNWTAEFDKIFNK